MANIEMDTLMRRKNKEGDIEIHYPITRAENVLELEEKIQAVSNSEQIWGKLENISESVGNLKENLDEKVSSRAPAETALKSEIWTDERAKKIDLLDGISERIESTSENASEVKNLVDEKISSRAPADTALSNKVWTDEKSGNLDSKVSSRAPADTALSNEIWTADKAETIELLRDYNYGLHAIRNAITGIQNQINELYAFQNSVLVAVEEVKESYPATVQTSISSSMGNSSQVGMSRGVALVRFVPEFSGSIALKFSCRTNFKDNSGEWNRNTPYSISVGAYGLLYRRTSQSPSVGDFTQSILQSNPLNLSSIPRIPDWSGYEHSTLKYTGNSWRDDNITANSSYTIDLDTSWVHLNVTKGEELVFAVLGTSSVNRTFITSSMTVSNMSVQIGYNKVVV